VRQLIPVARSGRIRPTSDWAIDPEKTVVYRATGHGNLTERTFIVDALVMYKELVT
jgi:hypothetical protein